MASLGETNGPCRKPGCTSHLVLEDFGSDWGYIDGGEDTHANLKAPQQWKCHNDHKFEFNPRTSTWTEGWLA